LVFLRFCLWPILLALLAAHCYPLGGSRLTLFLAPALFLLAGAGAHQLFNAKRSLPAQWFAIAVSFTLTGWGLLQAGYRLMEPRSRSHIRPAIESLRARHRVGEVIYTLSPAEFFCYWREADDKRDVQWQRTEKIPTGRFWVIFAFSKNRGYGSQQRWLRQFSSNALEQDRFMGSGGAAFLFERLPENDRATAR